MPGPKPSIPPCPAIDHQRAKQYNVSGANAGGSTTKRNTSLFIQICVIGCFARSVYHLGPNGAGARTKLIINHVLGLNRLALAEGLVAGMKAKVDMETLLEVLKDSAAYSKAMDQRGQIMIRADYGNPISRIRQHHKDVRLILEQGQKLGSPMPLEQVHQQVLQAAEMNGLADADTGAIIEVLRRLAGIPSR